MRPPATWTSYYLLFYFQHLITRSQWTVVISDLHQSICSYSYSSTSCLKKIKSLCIKTCHSTWNTQEFILWHTDLDKWVLSPATLISFCFSNFNILCSGWKSWKTTKMQTPRGLETEIGCKTKISHCNPTEFCHQQYILRHMYYWCRAKWPLSVCSPFNHKV